VQVTPHASDPSVAVSSAVPLGEQRAVTLSGQYSDPSVTVSSAIDPSVTSVSSDSSVTPQ
jgi:hypothetical protein